MSDTNFTSSVELTAQQVDELVSVLTKRCSHKTKVRIRSLVTYDFITLVRTISWFNRFYIREHDKAICYNAGQSYPCEIKAIRNEILRKYP